MAGWRAWLTGHEFDLQTLTELFSTGDPRVGHDPAKGADGYYIESDGLGTSAGHLDQSASSVLIKRINGIARALDPGFRPVELSDTYTTPQGGVTVVLGTATVDARARITAAGIVSIDGVAAPMPPPKGARYAKLAEADPNVADVLRVLGQPEPLDWYDVYKAWEIVEHAAGGIQSVVSQGWATGAELNRLTASANHPGISGDDARHARMRGTPGADRIMTLGDADALIRRLVAHWIESHLDYQAPR